MSYHTSHHLLTALPVLFLFLLQLFKVHATFHQHQQTNNTLVTCPVMDTEAEKLLLYINTIMEYIQQARCRFGREVKTFFFVTALSDTLGEKLQQRNRLISRKRQIPLQQGLIKVIKGCSHITFLDCF